MQCSVRKQFPSAQYDDISEFITLQKRSSFNLFSYIFTGFLKILSFWSDAYKMIARELKV